MFGTFVFFVLFYCLMRFWLPCASLIFYYSLLHVNSAMHHVLRAEVVFSLFLRFKKNAQIAVC
jgi:hypothetical protein